MNDEGNAKEQVLSRKPTQLLNSVNGKPAIHLAIRNDSEDILPLIESGCDVNAKDSIHGDTAMHVACFYGNLEAVFTLLQNGADMNTLNNNGDSPLDRFLSLCSQPFTNSMVRSRLVTAHCMYMIGFRINSICQGQGRRRSQRQKILQLFGKEHSSCHCLMSLQHVCRLSLRSHLTSSGLKGSIEKLPIPRALKNFLMFKQVSLHKDVMCPNIKTVVTEACDHEENFTRESL